MPSQQLQTIIQMLRSASKPETIEEPLRRL